MDKELFGYLSLVLVIASAVPYMLTVHKGKTKPHLFSWIIWTIPTAVVFAGQAVSDAGAGGWATGFTLLCNIFIVWQSFKYADKNITRSDWLYLIGCLAAIPLWMIAKDPLYSVILVTLMDVLGYGPTVRKSWNTPHDENAFAYFMLLPKHVASLLAMESYSVTNTLFPYAMIVINGMMCVFLLIRRRQLAKT